MSDVKHYDRRAMQRADEEQENAEAVNRARFEYQIDRMNELGRTRFFINGNPAEEVARHTADESCPLCSSMDTCRYTRVSPMEPIGRRA